MRPKTRSGAWLTVISVTGVMLAGACSTVRPYERGALSKPKMQLDPCPEGTLLENHVYEYREGSAGASGAVGGGCGCN